MSRPDVGPGDREDGPVAKTLHVALQDGFDDDLVVVTVNGAEVLRKSDVRTDYRISLAHEFDVNVPAGELRLKVEMPDNGKAGEVTIGPEGPGFVGVSFLDGEIQFILSEQPFGYL